MNPWMWVALFCLAVGVFVVVSYVLQNLTGVIALALAAVAAYYMYQHFQKTTPKKRDQKTSEDWVEEDEKD